MALVEKDLEKLRRGSVQRLRYAWEDIIVRYAYDSDHNPIANNAPKACERLQFTSSKRSDSGQPDVEDGFDDDEGVVDFADANWEEVLLSSEQANLDEGRSVDEGKSKSSEDPTFRMLAPHLATHLQRQSRIPQTPRKESKEQQSSPRKARSSSTASIKHFMLPSSKKYLGNIHHLAKISGTSPKSNSMVKKIDMLHCDGPGRCSKSFCLSCGSLSPARTNTLRVR